MSSGVAMVTAPHLVDELGLRHRGVPAVMEDEDVRLGDPLTDLMEEQLLLDRTRPELVQLPEPGQSWVSHWIPGQNKTGSRQNRVRIK